MKSQYPFAALLFLLLLPHLLSSQPLPWFTQYLEYQGLINPATVNREYVMNGSHTKYMGLSYRQEGVDGFEEVPVTQALRLEWIPGDNGDKDFRLLLGGNLMLDRFGPTGFTGAFGRIAAFSRNGATGSLFSGGLTFGAVQFGQSASRADIRLPDGSTTLPIDEPQQWYPNVGLGLFYQKKMSDRQDWYFGLSSPQILHLDLTDTAEVDFSTKVNPQVFGVIGSYLYTSDYSFWEPSVWLRSQPDIGFNVDLNLRYHFRNSFWVGTGGSSAKILHFEFGSVLGRGKARRLGTPQSTLRLGFGYDYSISELAGRMNHAFELNVALVLP